MILWQSKGPNLFWKIGFGVWCYLKTFILSYPILPSSLKTNSPPNLISTLTLFFTISLYLTQPYLLTKTKLLPLTQTYLLTKSKTEQLTQPLYNTTLNHTPNKLLHWTIELRKTWHWMLSGLKAVFILLFSPLLHQQSNSAHRARAPMRRSYSRGHKLDLKSIILDAIGWMWFL